MLRRLYSTFAGGWPGIGLLLMRLVVGAVVLWHAGPRLFSDPPLHGVIAYAALAVAALLLMAGLWTPLAGAVVAVVVVSETLTTGEPPVGHLLAATIAAGLALLIALLSLSWSNAFYAVLLAGATGLAIAWLALRQIGGQTGDVLGGAEQVAETAILVLLAARLA